MTRERNMKLDAHCQHCGRWFILEVNDEDFVEYLCGDLTALDAFPYLTGNERELLLSNTCGKCWDEMMADLFDDEDEEGFSTDWDSDFDEPDPWESLM